MEKEEEQNEDKRKEEGEMRRQSNRHHSSPAKSPITKYHHAIIFPVWILFILNYVNSSKSQS